MLISPTCNRTLCPLWKSVKLVEYLTTSNQPLRLSPTFTMPHLLQFTGLTVDQTAEPIAIGLRSYYDNPLVKYCLFLQRRNPDSQVCLQVNFVETWWVCGQTWITGGDIGAVSGYTMRPPPLKSEVFKLQLCYFCSFSSRRGRYLI